jgi:hypothetical protein
MDEANTIDYPRDVTFEQVWAILERSAKHQEEADQEMKKLRKTQEETDRLVKETQKAVKETQKSIGGLSGAVGTMAENLLTPSLLIKFKKLGFTFEKLSPHQKIYNADNTIYAEIDAFLENGDYAMAVETKLTCKREDIDYHLKRMEKIRKHADSHNDKRHYFGAIASPVIDEDTERYALKLGFYVIELAGEDAQIIKPDTERVW